MIKTKKKILTVIMTFTCVFSLLANTACNKPSKVEYYPEVEVVETPVDDENGGEEVVEEKEEELDEALLPEYISFRETGEFKLNPEILHPSYKEQVKNNPKVIKAAKKALQAVYNGEETVTFDEGDEEYQISELKLAAELASMSNPMCDVVYTTEDKNEDGSFNLVYFSKYELDEFNQRSYDSGISGVEAKERFDDFEKFVTEIVNNSGAKQTDSDIEVARLIYKELIENVTLIYPSEEDGGLQAYFTSSIPGEETVIKQTTIIDRANARELELYDVISIYEFILTQLGIKCEIMGANGKYVAQSNGIDAQMSTMNTWIWPIVYSDDKAYHCDIIFDKTVLDEQRVNFPDYESDLLYFGMSDKTRDESFQPIWSQMLGTVIASKQLSVPKCEEDYEFK